MKTYLSFIAASDIKLQGKWPLHVKLYRTVGIAKEVRID
jgi:hypothetical protein